MKGIGHNKRKQQSFRRELRRRQTDVEAKIWYFLRNRRFLGLKFSRQYGVGPYIVDFYCHALRLAIELDGGQHNEPAVKAMDQARTDFLNAEGIRVIRFWNNDVLENLSGVLERIRAEVSEATDFIRLADRGLIPSLGREGEGES